MPKIENILDIELFQNATDSISVADGLISAEIETGNINWQGDWSQADAGSFTIVSRNSLLDPFENSSVKFNTRIVFTTIDDDYTFFEGFITDTNVEYLPDGTKTITINGTDRVGLLKRILITQDMIDYMLIEYPDEEPLDFETLMRGAIAGYFYNELDDIFMGDLCDFIFENGELGLDPNLGYGVESNYRPGKYWPKVGQSLWDIVCKYAQTNLDNFSYRYDQQTFPQIYVRGFYKYNPYNYELLNTEFLNTNADFNSVTQPYAGYTSIEVAQTFDKVINQSYFNNEAVSYDNINNEYIYTTENFGPFEEQDSIENYGVSGLEVGTYMPPAKATTLEFERYSNDIFFENANPSIEVISITFDNYSRRLENYYAGEVVRIKHRVNDSITIDKEYVITGINHSIIYDEWITKFNLKPSERSRIWEHQADFRNAEITMNALTGDSNFNFVASISNFPSEKIQSITWTVAPTNALQFSEASLAAKDGFFFKDDTPRTGNTLTFNGDDDGILKYYLAGEQTVWAVINDIDNFTTVLSKNITITSAVVEADFVYSINQYGGVQFTDASSSDVDTWSWNFGDSTTSTAKNPPIKYYNGPGTYTVTLTVSNGITTDTHTESITLTNEYIPVRYVRLKWDNVTNYIGTSGGGTRLYSPSVVNTIGQMIVFFDGSDNVPYPWVNPNATIGTWNMYDSGSPWTDTGACATSPANILKRRITNKLNVHDTNAAIHFAPQSSSGDTIRTYQGNLTLEILCGTLNCGSNPSGICSPVALEQLTPRLNITNVQIKLEPFYINLNTTYAPIDVEVSSDNTNWYKIGEMRVGPITTKPPYPNPLTINMTPTVPLPPRFPS